mmetsp:Transcript_17971/g.44021  ORF Transcript_17971/g.44021 Transcript_17971/m.44021 type:complete len:299 (-) Transcript_17971:2653-3549(-)
MQSHSKRPLGAFGSASCAIWKICSPSPSASFLSRSASSRTFCSSLETTEPAVVLPMRLAAWLSFRILLQLRWRPETRSRVTSASSSRLLASPDTVRESDWIWFLMVFRDVKAIDDTSPSDFTDVVTAYSSALISAIFRWSVEARAFPLSLVDSSRSLGRVGPLCGVRSCAHAASSAVTASSEGSAERRASCIFASRPESRSASATSRRTSASWPTSRSRGFAFASDALWRCRHCRALETPGRGLWESSWSAVLSSLSSFTSSPETRPQSFEIDAVCLAREPVCERPFTATRLRMLGSI